MTACTLSTFGQELYLRETIEAARLLDNIGTAPGAVHEIAALLTQPSAITRERLATKILQRLRAAAGGRDRLASFVRLLARTEDSEARRELVLYGVSVADPIVGAIASEILYPFFVEELPPPGSLPEDASPQRDGLLLTVEPVVTMRFILDYARRRWQYHSARSVRLAMRILHRGGVVLPQRLRASSRSIAGYVLAPHGISFPAFVWCLVAEFHASAPPTEAMVLSARFVRNLVVPPSVVHARLNQCEREGFVRTRSGGGRRLLLAYSPERTVERLLAR